MNEMEDGVEEHLHSVRPGSLSPDITRLQINDRIVAINRVESERYMADEAARKRYWAKHPTFLAATKCMDGRVHLPYMTRTPMGLVKPFRAIGGAFDVFWPAFAKRLDKWMTKAMLSGSRCFVFVTYHYSCSETRLGCAGFKHDTDAAICHMRELQQQISYVWGEQVTAILTGVETDRDVLILHGPNGDISGEMLNRCTEEDIIIRLRRVFPKEDRQTLKDLVPFLAGNASHVADHVKNPRNPAALEHDERVIALGQEFGWFAQSNLALIINDADPMLDNGVVTAASIIARNLERAIPGDDATLFVNVPYEEPGKDYRLAVTRARGLMRFAERQIRTQCPQLIASGRLHHLVGVTFEPSKELTVIEQGGPFKP